MTEAKPAVTDARKLEQAQSGTARAALLGISDGLVTNVALILGVAAAGADARVVQVAGIASLIAGACSMAVGEYISMKGQVELLESILKAEEEALHKDPANAKRVLHDIMLEDGMSDATAHQASAEVAADPTKAMAMYARGKLGLNPAELGSVWGSASSSFVMFSLGALVPLVPWFFLHGEAGIVTSLAVSAVAALGIGGYLGHSTHGRIAASAIRQLIVLILASGVTYGIGRLFGVNLT